MSECGCGCKSQSKKPITAVIVGAGHRSLCCASYAQTHPDEFQIVGVADPNPIRRKQAADIYKIPPERCFTSAEELAKHPKIADAVINGTMDKDHVPTSLPLLSAGYHILLEKPIGVSQEEILELLDRARATKRTVMICHVLRYAPFYVEIRKRIANGDLGQVLNIQIAEHVSYHHISVAFVRGKWNRKDVCQSSVLMSKCCHDMDLLAWLKSGTAPKTVTSLGGRMFFRSEMAPEGSGTRCLVDCPIEPDCLYSAKKLHIDSPHRWSMYVWPSLEHIENPTIEDKIHSLKTDNPHGKCIWKCDNNVVDHQSVVVEFADRSTATHNLVGGTSKPCRTIHVLGTKGEIRGVMEDGYFVFRKPDPRLGHEYTEERVDINVADDMHGGGDMLLVQDFVRTLQGQTPSISSTTIEDSIYGHMIGFTADQAMEEHKVIDLKQL